MGLFGKKRIGIWFGVNKNGTVVMFATEPTKDEENGRWISKFPMVNSRIYPEICKFVEQAKLTFENEIQFIELSVE